MNGCRVTASRAPTETGLLIEGIRLPFSISLVFVLAGLGVLVPVLQPVSYNLLLRPEWAPDQWHVVEQSGYCRVTNDQVTRLDLVCTGFFPTSGDAA